MNNRDIYLIFSKTGTWLSNIIVLFSETKYVHSAISFDNSFTQMYSFGRTNPDNPFSGGFAKESLYDGVYKRSRKSECLIYKLSISEEQYICLKEQVDKFLEEQNKYRYNFLGLITAFFNKPLKRKYHYFCTQFVSEILIKSNIYHSAKPPELISPDDLLLIENKEFVYQGFVNQYYQLEEAYIFK